MITPINNFNLQPCINLQTHKLRDVLSFQNRCVSDVVSFGNKNSDLLSLSDSEITKRIKLALNNGDILGEGGEAVVYKIPDSNYCVRRRHHISEPECCLRVRSFTRNVTAQDKVNHVVAKIGKNITVMPIIEGVPVKSVFMSENECSKIAAQIESFPQSAFQSLLRQISEAYDKDMMWDCNWSNLIVNPSKKSLTAIDFYKNTEEEAPSHLAYMFAGLVHDLTTEKQCKIYAEKIMNAGMEEFKPGVTPCCSFDNFGFSDFIREIDDLELFENKNYIKLLYKITYNIRDLKRREILGENVTNDLNGQIKVVKSIMRQLAAS
ncbi:MAG: hypothetical protein NC191_07465 [Muribaculaceae bacterium]|nr:hypothetical protein [Muribaculaceae bacterium]